MKNHFPNILTVISFLFFISCESDTSKIERAEKECKSKTSIDGFNVSFYGYFTEDADSIQIKIKRGNQIIDVYQDLIPHEVSDSIRHLRDYYVERKINLTDTVFLKIKNEPEIAVSDFKYLVRPNFGMMKRDWGCDFYELKVNGEISEGAHVAFTKKGWDFVEREDFKKYYSGK